MTFLPLAGNGDVYGLRTRHTSDLFHLPNEEGRNQQEKISESSTRFRSFVSITATNTIATRLAYLIELTEKIKP